MMPDRSSMKKAVRFRFFFEVREKAFKTLLLLEFHYDEEIDWYELKVYRGTEIVAYVHGYANRGWTPQVNNIWVEKRFRRKGIASVMMSKVEDYFGEIPLPATPIEDNDAARAFWKNYMKESWVASQRKKSGEG
jgi:GNAT superfamily N-acetyltransferase